ncbi:MAG: integration host factor subunit alpha [Thermodesulfobacteriota bacterium]
MALTKENIINQVYETTQLPKNRAREVVETTLELMKATLANGEDLLVSGFGKFMVKDKQARRGRNPQTRQDLQLRARRVVVFKTSGVLRRGINGTEEV